MARYFLDSSALVKRYHQESGSADLERLFSASGDRFFVSRLALLELHSAFARLVREKVINKTNFDTVIARLEEDVASGLLLVAALSARRLEQAAVILGTHGMKTPIRTLDAIHLATAQAIDKRTRLASFVAADKKLLAAATVCGLAVLDVG